MRREPSGFVVICVLVLLTASFGCGDNRGGDVPRIRAALEAIPGVRVVDVVGWDEFWPLVGPEDIRADLQIGANGHLLLCNLTTGAVAGNSPFIIARVGEWTPLVMAERDMGQMRFVAGCPNSVDVVPGSAFLKLVPFPIRSATEAIANYDRLNALIESWPSKPTRVQASDGSGWIQYYRIPFQPEAVGGDAPTTR